MAKCEECLVKSFLKELERSNHFLFLKFHQIMEKDLLYKHKDIVDKFLQDFHDKYAVVAKPQ